MRAWANGEVGVGSWQNAACAQCFDSNLMGLIQETRKGIGHAHKCCLAVAEILTYDPWITQVFLPRLSLSAKVLPWQEELFHKGMRVQIFFLPRCQGKISLPTKVPRFLVPRSLAGSPGTKSGRSMCWRVGRWTLPICENGIQMPGDICVTEYGHKQFWRKP